MKDFKPNLWQKFVLSSHSPLWLKMLMLRITLFKVALMCRKLKISFCLKNSFKA